MALIIDNLIRMLITIIVFIISSIPLYLAVKFLGGKTSILKTAIISFLAGIIVSVIQNYFSKFGGIIAFIVLIWIYHEMFKLKWIKAFLAWLLQFVILALFYILLGIFGITLISLL